MSKDKLRKNAAKQLKKTRGAFQAEALIFSFSEIIFPIYFIYMKRFALICLLLFSSLSLFSGTFHIGIDAGYVLGLYDQRGGERESRTFSPGHSFEVSIPIEYRINSYVSLSSGLRYIEKAYGINNTVDGVNFLDIRKVEHYIHFPLTVRGSLENERVRGYLGLGGYLGVRVLSSSSGYMASTAISPDLNTEHRNEVIELDSRYDNLFDAGLLAEAGVEFSLDDRFSTYLNARYQYSLTMLDRKYQRDFTYKYIDTFSIDCGLLVRIGGER